MEGELLFKYMRVKYPHITEGFEERELHFDNVYIDLDHIIICCTRINRESDINATEEELFKTIFCCIDVVLTSIQPKKLLFLAASGVAPRAIFRQQRSSNFREAKRLNKLFEKWEAAEKKSSDTPRCDRNRTTPGTQFMAKLQAQLEYHIVHSISTNPLWQKCKVILSGPQVPGEGKHKIMEYVRYSKTLPDYNPNTRHCIVGMDTVFLSLCTHLQNILVVQVYDPMDLSMVPFRFTEPYTMEFWNVHVSLIREYLDLDFQELKTILPFSYNLENIIDDWVLLTFILGNDLVPQSPYFGTGKCKAMEILCKAYKEVAPTLNGYINEQGHLNLSRFRKLLEKLALYEVEMSCADNEESIDCDDKIGEQFIAEKGKENVRLTDPVAPVEGSSEEVCSSNNESIDNTVRDSVLPDLDVSQDCKDEDLDYNTAKSTLRHNKKNCMTKYPQLSDEELSSLSEDYLRALQWLLHYYYHGCKSWSWYYPHHYAPHLSDVKNFKDVNLNFEIGKPLLPYEALLSILPAASKDLVPKAYHKLMTSPDSPLKDYYSENFESDFNSRDHGAVKLLPIVDEKELLNAMTRSNDELTPEEKLLNKHGSMRIYSFTSEDQGLYKAPQYFPDVLSNYALMETLEIEKWVVDECDVNARSQKINPENDAFYLHISTFKHIPHEVKKKTCEVKVPGGIDLIEGLVVTLIEKEKPDIEKVASELLGNIVYVDWPHLKEARVVAVSTSDNKWVLSDSGSSEIEKRPLTIKDKEDFEKNKSRLEKKIRMDIGEIEVLVHVHLFSGLRLNFDMDAVLSRVKVWDECRIVTCPVQVVVKDINIYEPECKSDPSLEEVFPIGSEVFMLGHPYYGCKGRVMAIKNKKKGCFVQVQFEVPEEEHIIGGEIKDRFSGAYFSASAVAEKIGVCKAVLGMIAGTIFIDISNPDDAEGKKIYLNIGLQLRNNKKNIEVPGFTKRQGSCWLYSKKAVNTFIEYIERYPLVVRYLTNSCKHFIIPRNEIFPDPNGEQELRDLVEWLDNLECSKAERVQCGSQFLSKEIIADIEKLVDGSSKKFCTRILCVRPALLYKSGFVTGIAAPVESADHQLFDRITTVGETHTVPLGSRGYIIGIRKTQFKSETEYEILYDEPVFSKMDLNCSPGRGYSLNGSSFINISHGERIHQLRKEAQSEVLDFHQTVDSSIMLNKERPSSAFAQWNNCPSVPLNDDAEDRFKSLWSYLEKVKSQDETKVLKQILKIEEDDSRPIIEDNVKSFFESISKNTENFVPKSNVAELEKVNLILHKSQQKPESNYRIRLLNYFISRNIGQPRFSFVEVSDKIVSQVIFPDGRMYKGFPCDDEESASESAALQALGALGELKVNNNCQVQKVHEGIRKIMNNQPKCDRSFIKGADVLDPVCVKTVDNIKSVLNSKSKVCSSDKNIRNGKPQQQQQQQPQQQSHRRNVPNVLPTPPLQWRRQSKISSNAHMDQWKKISNAKHHTVICNEGQKLKQDLGKQGGRISDNRLDLSGNHRCPDWKNDEKLRGQQSECRSAKDFFHYNNSTNNSNDNDNNNSNSSSNCNNSDNRRQRPNQSDSAQGISLRPDIYCVNQGLNAGNLKTATINSQDGSNGMCQRLSAVATEFIPLQALTRNRSRGNNMVTPKTNKEVPQTFPSVSSVKAAASPREPGKSPSLKQQRKSKIAAKFDAEWDPQC